MNNKFRDELREAHKLLREFVLDQKNFKGAAMTLPLEKCLQEMIALLSGTHETLWLAPKEPTEKMLLAETLYARFGLWMKRAKLERCALYRAMRDASQEERRG